MKKIAPVFLALLLTYAPPCLANNTVGGTASGADLTTGTDNTIIGTEAGVAITSGTDNTLLGYESGYGVTGSYNVILGEDPSSAITSGSSNILIGNSLTGLTATSSDQLNIGNVIIGTGINSPSSSLITLPGALTVTGTITGNLSGNATNVTGTVAAGNGGTGQTSIANAFISFFESVATSVGDLVYGGTSGTPTRLAGNTSSTTEFLTSTGTGSAAQAPAWSSPSSLTPAFVGSSITALNGSNISSGTVGVGVGGLGLDNPTAHYVLVGEGSSAVTPISPSTSGYVLTSNGTSSDPSFQAVAVPTAPQLQEVVETSGTSWTSPSYATSSTVFKITGVGGGGDGGAHPGSGGGAGAVCIWWLSGLSPSTGYTYAIGSTGGNTTFSNGSTTMTAAHGSAGAAASAGDSVAGGAGGACTNGTLSLGAGGGGAGTESATSGDSSGGAGGSNGFGGGGAAGGIGVNGGAGTGCGGGGGGAGNSTSSGGAGAPGCLLIEWVH